MSEMKTEIETIANMTVIVVALVLGCLVLNRYVASSRVPHSIAAGDRLAKLPGLDWHQHRRTLVLVLNTGCHFCQDSIPFYQKMAQAQHPDRDVPEIVAVFPNEAEIVRQFTAHEGLTIQSVPEVPLEKLHVDGTPTLILVNREGLVERSWMGVLTATQEMDLIKLVSGS